MVKGETMASRSKGAGGFTLIEMLVTLTVVAILAAVAVPGFRNLIAQSEIRQAATTLAVAMNRARSEATKRARTMEVVKHGYGWQEGWWVQDPADPPATNTPEDDPQWEDPKRMSVQRALNGVEVTSGANKVVYLSTGRVQGDPSTYRVTLTSKKKSDVKRCVSVDASGAPSIKPAAC
jgi:type IV fimbrial biogenesis protein FimT